MGKVWKLLARVAEWDFLLQVIILALVAVGGIIYALVN